jgi:hypothetical protein
LPYYLDKVHDFINSKISSISALAIDFASGNFFMRGGVTILTLLSVHCAERITATSNSKGFL